MTMAPMLFFSLAVSHLNRGGQAKARGEFFNPYMYMYLKVLSNENRGKPKLVSISRYG
jgi:hypothetical protein